MCVLQKRQPGFLIALTVTSWLRGANEGIDVDADVMLHRSEHLMYSARTALDGMEVDDTDFLRRVAGRVDAGTANARRRVRVPRDAQGLDEHIGVEDEDGLPLPVDADNDDAEHLEERQDRLASGVEVEGAGQMVDEVTDAAEDETCVGDAM